MIQIIQVTLFSKVLFTCFLLVNALWSFGRILQMYCSLFLMATIYTVYRYIQIIWKRFNFLFYLIMYCDFPQVCDLLDLLGDSQEPLQPSPAAPATHTSTTNSAGDLLDLLGGLEPTPPAPGLPHTCTHNQLPQLRVRNVWDRGFWTKKQRMMNFECWNVHIGFISFAKCSFEWRKPFIIAVFHSSHSNRVWERRRDFDTKLWTAVRLGPDGHTHSLQLHWFRHQQLYSAGCRAQGLFHYHW